MTNEENQNRDVSKIRQQIEYNAKTNMALKERERRIDAKRDTLRQEMAELKETKKRVHLVEQRDDGNIRVTIYIPRFLRNIILLNWFFWFAVLPTIAVLSSDQPGSVVYVPVLLLLSLIWLGLAFVGWYLYWWLVAIGFTLATILIIAGMFVGSIEMNNVREQLQNALR